MITDAVLNFIFGFFAKVFDLLLIPQTPAFITDALEFVSYWVGRGCALISWLFPESLYHTVVTCVASCLAVRFTYDLYIKFHRLTTHVPT